MRRFIQVRSEKRHKPTPAWDDRPQPYEDIAWIWSAFWVLRSRADASQERLIRLRDMLAWLEIYGVDDPEDRVMAADMWTFLDTSWARVRSEEGPPDAGEHVPDQD